MKKYLIVAILVLCGLLAAMIGAYNDLMKDRNRLSDNQRALMEDVTFYRTKDSLSAASVERLTLSNSEFKKYNEELNQTVEDLNIKVKRLQSISNTGTKTEYKVETVFRDSIVYVDNKPDTLRCLSYKDAWLTFDGCESKGVFKGKIESRDSLTTIVHRIPRKFLFFRWGTKAVRQEVLTKNPYSTIQYTKYLEFKK